MCVIRELLSYWRDSERPRRSLLVDVGRARREQVSAPEHGPLIGPTRLQVATNTSWALVQIYIFHFSERCFSGADLLFVTFVSLCWFWVTIKVVWVSQTCWIFHLISVYVCLSFTTPYWAFERKYFLSFIKIDELDNILCLEVSEYALILILRYFCPVMHFLPVATSR